MPGAASIRRPAFLVPLVLLALVLAGCASSPDAEPAAPAPTPAATPPPTPTPTMPGLPLDEPPVPPVELPEDIPTELGQLERTIRDGAFAEPIFSVPQGTTVTWLNEGTLVHSVVSADGGFAGSGPVAPGSDYARTFDRTGVYPFKCRYHPDMMGTITVV